MNRRSFIQLALAASAAACLPAYATEFLPPPRRSRPKRGLGLGSHKDEHWREKLLSVGPSWFYSWSGGLPENPPPDVEYVPMIFKHTSDAALAEARARFREHKVKHVLGFNEPDGKDQANMTVEEALALWPKLMEMAPSLGSPACVHPDREWMQAFMQGVKTQSLRVDFVTIHSYGGVNPDAFMKQLESVHKLYRRPLWITEFAVGDWKAQSRADNRYRPEQIVKFLEQVLPRLDRCDFVERYAWFPAKPENPALGPCAPFNEDGSLTPVGEAYRSL